MGKELNDGRKKKAFWRRKGPRALFGKQAKATENKSQNTHLQESLDEESIGSLSAFSDNSSFGAADTFTESLIDYLMQKGDELEDIHQAPSKSKESSTTKEADFGFSEILGSALCFDSSALQYQTSDSVPKATIKNTRSWNDEKKFDSDTKLEKNGSRFAFLQKRVGSRQAAFPKWGSNKQQPSSDDEVVTYCVNTPSRGEAPAYIVL